MDSMSPSEVDPIYSGFNCYAAILFFNLSNCLLDELLS